MQWAKGLQFIMASLQYVVNVVLESTPSVLEIGACTFLVDNRTGCDSIRKALAAFILLLAVCNWYAPAVVSQFWKPKAPLFRVLLPPGCNKLLRETVNVLAETYFVGRTKIYFGWFISHNSVNLFETNSSITCVAFKFLPKELYNGLSLNDILNWNV